MRGETAEAGGAESKDDGMGGGKGPRGVERVLVVAVEAWTWVIREGRRGNNVVERAEEGGGGAVAAAAAVAAGCRPRKTPKLIFLVSDRSFFQAGV